MGGDRQIAQLRTKAKRAGEVTQRVIARLRSEALSCHALITFFETAAQHEGQGR